MKKEMYTLGIPKENVKGKGLLPLLFENGVTELLKIKMSGAVYKPIVGQSTYRTKFFKVRNFFATIFEVNGENVNTEDLLNDSLAHNFPIDRQIKEVTFKDFNGHIVTLKKQRRNTYRVSHIDGKSVLEGFTKNEIAKMREGSIFESLTTGFCKIRKKAIQPIEYECDFEKSKEV